MKICTKCGETKSPECFCNDKTRKDGLFPHCRDCVSLYKKQNRKRLSDKQRIYMDENRAYYTEKRREYYAANAEELKEKSRLYRRDNPEKVAAYNRLWEENNRGKRREYYAERISSDIEYRLAHHLRCRTRKVLKLNKKTDTTIAFLGCSISELKRHLEMQFVDGMSWENYGVDGWHIDHIKPCAAFNLSEPLQQAECFHYTNLQPLWAADNIRKGCHYVEAV